MSVFLPSNVLAQFATNVELVVNASTRSEKFTRANYRFTLETQPDSAPDGMYFLDLQSIAPHLRRWGDGSQITDSVVAVRLLYSRPGGSLGGGDRQSVLRNAADDCTKLADVCENPANYGQSTSGIRIVTFAGAQRVSDQGKAEIWEVRFNVQWQSDMDTTTVGDDVVNRVVLDGVSSGTNTLVAYNVTSLGTGAQAFCVAEWRSFTLDKTSTQTPDGATIIGATPTGSGNWFADTYYSTATGLEVPTV